MSTPCFLVVRRHGRVVEEDGRPVTVYDAVREDTGEVLAQGITSPSSRVLIPGAMWWQVMEETSHPSGPEDWPATTVDVAVWETMPDEQRRAVTHVRRGGEPRHPSHLFERGPALHLCVVCPGPGHWTITSRASNCTLPYDYAHRCWVVHGEPPTITVDKAGLTCAAGGGSIQCGGYHGFLQGGVLT